MRSLSVNDNQDFEKKTARATGKLLALLQQNHDYSVPFQVVEKKIIEIRTEEPEELPVGICVLPIREPTLTIEGIKRVVCLHYGISHEDMISPRRDKKVNIPRMIGIYLARTLTVKCFSEISKRFGRTDHTTAIYSFRKIERLVNGGDPIASHVQNLREILTA